MSTIEESPDVRVEPSADMDLQSYESLHTDFYGEVRFAFDPSAGDERARTLLFEELRLAYRKPRGSDERLCPWTLRHEKGLIILSDWANAVRRQFPDAYDEDRHFFGLVRDLLCRIVRKPPEEAPSFEPAMELEHDRKLEEQRLLQEYRLHCSRGGPRRAIAALLESCHLKAPPPVPHISREYDYKRFLAHNGQMKELVRWFMEHRQKMAT